MFFSIVIPLYNKEEYVSKTIASVLEQTYPDFEVLIIDDGSTDNSVAVVEQYTDDRIRIIRQRNQGVSAARNTGIKEAAYELIALLDADDWWDKCYLEEMVSLINEYPDVSIYCSQSAQVKAGIIYPDKKILNRNTGCFDLLQMGIKLNTLPIRYLGVIFRRCILEKSGFFDARISYGEDWDFFIRIGIYSKLAFVEKGPLTYYNHDVDVNKRTVGNLPPIKKHLLNYTHKYAPYYKEHPYLKAFIDRFILNFLYLHNHSEGYSIRKRELLKDIPMKEFTFSQIIKYYMPNFILDFMLNINRKLRGIKRLNIPKGADD
jgi:glycosyltransferase involved in cell wall biosynthesis